MALMMTMMMMTMLPRTNAAMVRIMMIRPLAPSLMSTSTYISDDPACKRRNSSEITLFVGQDYYLSGAKSIYFSFVFIVFV